MYNKNFLKALNFLFPSEGGYTNNKLDLGGPTNMGVTQYTYNNYRQKRNLVTKDVKNITREEAIDIYYNEYWVPSGANNISNPRMGIILFDTAVLHGPYQARSFYKQSDGNIDKYLDIRRNFYKKRVLDNPSQKIFYDGWQNRVDNLQKFVKQYTGFAANIIPLQYNDQKGNVVYYTGQEPTIDELENLSLKDRVIYDTEVNLANEDDDVVDRFAEQYYNNESYTKDDLDERVKSGELIYVESYYRSDGTKVSGYYRRKRI